MGTTTVKISEITTPVYVRTELNDDRVLFFWELIEAKEESKIAPIKITRKKELVDGRHRKAAYENAERTEIPCEFVDVKDEVDMIVQAFKANNTGGPLPPTPADTEHTIRLMLDRNAPATQVGRMLGIPADLARSYINRVLSKVQREKLLNAARAVTDGGLTVPKAAEKYGVDVEDLRAHLSGRKRRKPQNGVADIQRRLTFEAKSKSSTHAAMLSNLLDRFRDGDVTESQVAGIFDHLDTLSKRTSRNIADWKGRFDSMRVRNSAK